MAFFVRQCLTNCLNLKKKRGCIFMQPLDNTGSSTWARTRDLRINSPSLYRLSYRGIKKNIISNRGRLVKLFSDFYL